MCNPNVHYHHHKSPPLDLILSQINPLHIYLAYSIKVAIVSEIVIRILHTKETFQVQNFMSIFSFLDRSKESAQVYAF
jgi:hypothetical protein